jgi:hypothetical protein
MMAWHHEVGVCGSDYVVTSLASQSCQLNVPRDRDECNIDGKTIISYSWISDQVQRSAGLRDANKTLLSNCKVFLDDQYAVGYYINYCNRNDQLFFTLFNIIANNTEIITTLPIEDGIQKKAYSWQPGGKGKSAAQSYVKYQNTRATFAGFGKGEEGKGPR